jgi:hypothetical protein
VSLPRIQGLGFQSSHHLDSCIPPIIIVVVVVVVVVVVIISITTVPARLLLGPGVRSGPHQQVFKFALFDQAAVEV